MTAVAQAPIPGSRRLRRASLVMMFASGFSALGLQIVWTQQGALWLGHESAALLAVITAFFAGIGLGARWCGERIERSAYAGRWYAGAEALIALWSSTLIVLIEPISALLERLTGEQPSALWQWSVAFAGTFVLLLPATAAMGVTLPALERAGAASPAAPRSVATLYAANTAGGVFGVLAGAFWLIPALGLARTTLACAALNVVCALIALRTFGLLPTHHTVLPAARPAGRAEWVERSILLRLGFSGFLGIGLEVLMVRVLSQIAEDTVYTFALLLAIYLVGTSLGAVCWRRLGERQTSWSMHLPWLLAAACLASTVVLWAGPMLQASARLALGESLPAALAAESLPALAAFALPTLIMGALFSDLCGQAHRRGISFGRAFAANTVGAMCAPIAAVAALPAFGTKECLLVIATGYLLLLRRDGGWRTALPPTAFVAAPAAALAVFAAPLAFVTVPPGGHIVSYRDGASASVSVVADAGQVARLRIDDREQEGSSATRRVDSRQAWLPLLLHPAPRTALFLGLGTGVTARAAAQDPALQVDAVELLPEVVDASRFFVQPGDQRAAARLRIVIADARRYVRSTAHRYDVIVADNYHPARSGSGSLYTIEHFAAIRARLAPGGWFCQWLPLHQLDLPTLRSIVAAFLRVYPDGSAILASNSLDTPVIGLVAHAGALPDLGSLRRRLAGATSSGTIPASGFEDEFAVLGAYIAGPRPLARFAADAPPNTDDRPIVAYGAPRIAYVPDSAPRDRLLALLDQLSVAPDDTASGMDAADANRLTAWWQARNRFLALGRDARPLADVRRMLAEVGEPLLQILHVSPDFRPAYDPLLRMAAALAQSDPAAARILLRRLDQVQPARGEARAALVALDGGR